MNESEEMKFDIRTLQTGHHGVSYRGVKAVRIPFDYVLYDMLVYELKPDLIIEIGTAYGGSALKLADMLEFIGKGMVHTIDATDFMPANTEEARNLIINHPRITRFVNGWEGYDLNNAKGFEKIMVIEDGNHYYTHCLETLKKFSSLISIGSSYIVEDGLISYLDEDGVIPGTLAEEYQGGPLRAIREFLVENTNFIVDRRWCDFFGKNATGNVNGYLKRIS
jgi:cephalosporin hydroxylase